MDDESSEDGDSVKNLEDRVIERDGIVTHFVSDEGLEEVKSFENFDQIHRYFGRYWDLFLKEYGVEGIRDYCFETLNRHLPKENSFKKHCEDTYLMSLFDLKGNAIIFQKYNGNVIVLHEIEKLKKGYKLGGRFQVTDFKICEDNSGNPYIEETTKSRTFEDEDNIHKARTDAIKYMQSVVEYHDAQEGIKKLEGLDFDPSDTNRFKIQGDEHGVSFCFDYHEISDKSGFESIHEREDKKLEDTSKIPPNIVTKLRNILKVNEGCFRSAQKPYRVMHYV